jgi:anti-anti-sigma regulatory factor
MSQEKNINVPAIFEGFEKEKVFKEQLDKALEADNRVILDFQSHPAVSSLILGYIMFHLKDHLKKIQLINVSDYMYKQLKMIIGQFTDNLIKGRITKLDIATSEEETSSK